MSKPTPERLPALSARKPTPHFSWPPTKEQLTQRSAQAGQRLISPDRPTDLDSPLTNAETSQRQAARPRADFSWPPTADQLAARGFAGTPSVAAGEGTAVARHLTPAASDATSLAAVSTPSANPPTAVISADALPAPADDPAPSQTEVPSYVGDSISVIPVAQRDAAFDGRGTGDWAADVARLQAAIERVTEKVEWRTRASLDID